MNALLLAKAASKYLRYLEGAGYAVEMSTDFEGVVSAAAETGRNHQLPTFCVERVDHTETSAFWLFLTLDGARVAGVAAILQDIGRENFASYLRRVARHQYPNPSGEAISVVASPLGDEVGGRLAYIGELSVRRDRRGRHKELAAFMRLLQVMVLLEWGVEWTYAFVPDTHMRAQLARQYGFSRYYPKAQTWVTPVPELRSCTEWFVGAKCSDLEWLFEVELGSDNIL